MLFNQSYKKLHPNEKNKMTPLKHIKGDDCKECNGFGKLMELRHQPSVSKDVTCKACQGTGKQPDKIICNIEDFEKCHHLVVPISCKFCSGTRHILPKKGKTISIQQGNLNSSYFDYIKFRLTKDAEVNPNNKEEVILTGYEVK